MKNNYEQSIFYCTRCGRQGIPVFRNKGKLREKGHLKTLFCIYCNDTVNHVEIKPDERYTSEDFRTEFEYHNFDAEGKRIYTYNQLKEMIANGKIKK